MNEETFIPMEDVIIKIKYHPDITEKDKKEFKRHLYLMYTKHESNNTPTNNQDYERIQTKG